MPVLCVGGVHWSWSLTDPRPPLPPHGNSLRQSNTPHLKVRKEDLEAWCIKQAQVGRKRIPAPADALGSLKLRGVKELQEEFDKVAAEGGVYEEGSGVGWNRIDAENVDDVGDRRLSLEECDENKP